MGETQLAPAGGGVKATTMALLAAHPVGIAIGGGILVGIGAYYIGKAVANRKKKAEAAAPAAA